MINLMKPLAMAGVLSLMMACGGGDPVAKALDIAKAGDPASALEKSGMSIDDFEALLYQIAEDPELTDKFEAGR